MDALIHILIVNPKHSLCSDDIENKFDSESSLRFFLLKKYLTLPHYKNCNSSVIYYHYK